MNKLFLSLILTVAMSSGASAQVPGDTVVVNIFNYNSLTRDTVADFSVLPNVSFEKILMKYNMRCHGGTVSSSGNNNGPNQGGCGEWDYSCNTYLHDSTRIDSVLYTTPDYTVSGFTGATFSYTSQPTYDFFQYTQNPVSVAVVSENQYPVLGTTAAMDDPLNGTNQSGKAQYLYTAAELTGAGFPTGNIDGFLVSALNAGTANFLRINIKGTAATTLDPNAPELTGFTEVYFSNYDFVAGSNRVQFSTPFVWNGTDNIIVEFSFTNTIPGTTIQLEGEASTDMGIFANNGYHINLEGETSIDVPTPNMTTIQDEITVSFWAYGNENIMPVNTSILHANNLAGDRNLNLHLPWSNSRIYWDCGNTGAGYDRIDQAATPSEIGGQWNHWAATKNAVTGVMNLYLNGTLWHTGSGKTNPIEIAEMIIGKTNAGSYNYKGSIDELRVWDTELSQTEIANWMNINVDATHPQYANLVAYYKMDEGTGALINDDANAQVGTSSDANVWKFTRGIKLSRFFQKSNNRPSLTFLEGTYNLTNNPTNLLDSVQLTPNIIETFTIASNAGTIMDDDIVSTGTTTTWEATPQNVYDAISGAVLYTIPVTAENTTAPVVDLPYYRRWPSMIELMSFVTPYGNNLDMGPNGETWTFDMTDYAPLFNGEKRINISRGGQWQEEMDINLEFIVGTPPRDVLDIRQIWRPESRGYVQIMDDTYFPPRDVLMHPSGDAFKVRSAITGHGQEGEFISRVHSINVGGGAPEFEWNVWKECPQNPVYPQGGTWIYDRAGWCPGMATDVQHHDITPYVTAGQVATIDYTVATASGSSNYIVNNQLVSYGAINHTLDAAIVEVSEPSKRTEFKRFNSICHSPKVLIKNTGSDSLTSVVISYWVNNAATPMTYNWTGSLAFGETEEVVLPSNYDLWVALNPADNVFHVELSAPNGGSDEYAHNNHYRSEFDITETLPSTIIVYFKTNNAASESSYKIFDENGGVYFEKSGMAANTLYKDTVYLGLGCYKYQVFDTDNDGIDFWANSDGVGYTRFFAPGFGFVKYFEADFGDDINFNFTVDFPLSYEEINGLTEVKLYPNPASQSFVLEGKDLHLGEVIVFDNLGKEVTIPFKASTDKVTFDSRNVTEGIYFVQIDIEGKLQMKKVVIE